MMTMMVEDVAAVAVIALFFWLVPMRRNGIPGLRGRGRAPASPPPMRLHPRPVPEDEKISAADDASVLAELDRTWDARYADRAATQIRGRRNSA